MTEEIKEKTNEEVKVEPQIVEPNSYVADITRTYLHGTHTEELTANVLADGIVTSREKGMMLRNHKEVIYDYLAAASLKEKMEKSPQNYSKAAMDAILFIYDRLHRARQKSYASLGKVFYYKQIPPAEIEKRRKRRKKREKIKLNKPLSYIFGMVASIGGMKALQQYSLKKEMNEEMTPEQQVRLEKKMMQLVSQVMNEEKKQQKEQLVFNMLQKDMQRAG